MREFASFEPSEQRYIKRALLLVKVSDTEQVAALYSRNSDEGYVIKAQQILYSKLFEQSKIPRDTNFEESGRFLSILIPVTAFDLAQGKLHCFSAYRFLYERMLGAVVRPWLPSAFVAAAALPQINPERRRLLLQSISEAAATAPGWSDREPTFFPEWVKKEVA
jgi:hypothetical protein